MNTNLGFDKVLSLLDKFTLLYNHKNGTVGSIFEGINMKDSTSTNNKMEMFYEYMQDHDELSKKNQLYVDVYDSSASLPTFEHTLYALIEGRNRKVKYISFSYISLLYVGTDEMKSDDSWGIIELK